MEIYQHFRKEEQPFIDQVLSWQEEVGRSFQRKLSDFLDPREQKIFASIIGNNEEFHWRFFGGGTKSERKRAILAPYYEEAVEPDFELVLLQASYPAKFVTLAHRDVLGSFLSLGIKRKKMGDLIVKDGVIQIIVASEISTYVQFNLTAIKKAAVSFAPKPLSALMEKDEAWQEKNTTVSSLRLDVVLKEIYNISRQNAAQFIQKGLVKVNFRVVESSAFLLEEGDLISLRGKGRSHVKAVHGLSRKDKYKITAEILK
ncbi:RNA-binding protein [Sediminibacillus albus]|uniref:RNA-binding protein YlmH, contains S4-like domain n=1 Tax=Sediminibacillus albus TaxID=407036 RepID=A0A1G8W6X9_9BACI|nr:YlmH/Sll1252 family protein [Sediminibacillus albus]SDJ73857.1 RNA-binding protein YlmH, contains S4-like domain [Sediminibacillus albus]